MRLLFTIVVIVTCLFILTTCENDKGFRIPLVRQKLPRQSALEFELDNKDRGILPSFLKPKPPKPPIVNATVALYRYLDSEFYGIINIAHQSFNVLFDTTWIHSWVISAHCPTTVIGCWFHEQYDETNSNTYVANDTKYSTNNKYFNLSGFYSYETFVIGQLTVKKQEFVQVTNIPYYNIFSKHDGVIGLGLKVDDYDPWIYNVFKLANTSFRHTLFSVYLSRDKQSSKGGAIIIGAIDKKHVHHVYIDGKTIYDPIVYVPIQPNVNFWQFTMDSVYVNKTKTVTVLCKNCNAIADTSSNTIMLPSSIADKLHKTIHAKYLMFGYYEVNCETVMKLPDIDFIINGAKFTLNGKQYTQKLSYKMFTICLSAFQRASPNMPDDVWVIGGAFLTQFYSIYDIENKRIGFVRAF